MATRLWAERFEQLCKELKNQNMLELLENAPLVLEVLHPKIANVVLELAVPRLFSSDLKVITPKVHTVLEVVTSFIN